MKSVRFKNQLITLAGNLHLPEEFNEGRAHPGIVCVHPSGGVKEQTTGSYARRMAGEGFVALAFDSSYQGDSGGEPHFLDEPMTRVDDVYAAIDYMTTLPYVDKARIGVLGICEGGGIAAKASCIDRRVKALATVSAVNGGASSRSGWEGRGSVDELLKLLDTLALQRTAEAGGADAAYVPYVPPLGDKDAPRDMQQAADYYLTSRGEHPNAQNKMVMNALGAWIGFEAFDLVDSLLTQPLLVMAGSEAGSLWHSRELYARAPGQKELVVLEGMTHTDLYDGDGLNASMKKLAPFFRSKL